MKEGKRKGEKDKRENSYYKWQSLPGAYNKDLSALRVPNEPLNCCHNEKVSLPQLGDYLSLHWELYCGI